MKKSFLPIVSLMAVMALVACGGGTKDSKPAGSSAGSIPPASSKAPASSKSSTSRAPVKSISVSSVDVAAKDGKVYLQVTGTAANFESLKFALALKHVGNESADPLDTYVYGSETFAAADYKYPVTLGEKGAFTAEFCLSDITTMEAGCLAITIAAEGFNGTIELGSTTGGLGARDGSWNYYIRADEQVNSTCTLAVDALPPISLTEAKVVKDTNGKVWAKVGGQLKAGVTQADLDAYDSFVNLQQVGGNWRNTRRTKADGQYMYVVEGQKAYLYIDISFFAAGTNYNTHLNVTENKQANCQLEVDVDEHFVYKNESGALIDINVYSNTKAKSDDQTEFWGNLGFKVTAAAEGAQEGEIIEPITKGEDNPGGGEDNPGGGEDNPGGGEQQEASCTVTALNIITENDKPTVEIKGTIAGIEAADAKFAFGLVSIAASGSDSVAGNWLVGSEEPADSAFTLVPTIADGQFTLKVDVSEVAFTGGIYRVVTGPKGHYAEVTLTSGIGTGDAKVNGHRIYLRSDLGAIAADELPPISLTESFLKIEDEKVYHYIGGEITMPEAEFLALTPYLNYEQCVQWKANKLASNLITTVMQDGKGYVKVDVTNLGEERYNVKLNLKEAKDVDTQMETIINTYDKPVILNGKAYSILADKTHTGDKNYIYGNLGLIVEHAHNIVPDGDKISQAQPIKCDTTKNDIQGFELHTNDMVSGQVPNLSDNNSRLGKGSVKENVWNIAGVASGEYEIQVFCAGKDAGTLDSHWDGRIDVAAGAPASNHGGDKAGYRYTFKAGDGEYVEPTTTKTMRETGMDLASGGWKLTETIGKIMISDTDATFSIKNMDNGYASFIEGVRLVRVGNYKAPSPKLVFDTENKARIECENYDSTSNRASVTATEDADASAGKYLGGLDSYGEEVYYNFRLDADVTVDINIRYNCYADANGYGPMEFYIDGAEIDQQNRGSSEEGWKVRTITAVTLKKGEHQIKIRNPYNSKTNYDYVEFLKVVA